MWSIPKSTPNQYTQPVPVAAAEREAANEQMSKVWFTQTVENYKAIKGPEALAMVTTQMKDENSMPSAGPVPRARMYCIIPWK